MKNSGQGSVASNPSKHRKLSKVSAGKVRPSPELLPAARGLPVRNCVYLCRRSVGIRTLAGSGRCGAQSCEHAGGDDGYLGCLGVRWRPGQPIVLLQHAIQESRVYFRGAKIRMVQDPPEQENISLDPAHEIFV